MPQMMPINWLLSFFFFICIFILFNIINYYIFNYNYNFKSLSKISSSKNNLFWKW
uniref:ATP synthase complex subunit 8 n=1 Tax=Ninguta schrenckii TaxID=669556 RepID=A0A0E3D915_9NEOP|nr:ATP synthase F0 subunit 8 [Ninguta schrenckii]AHH34407.1 ATP synthase F0 subunit 8 [Ninguta schrenckii]USH57544.1 ATP synthase F0 subunit 8 [Ninguta schrenckii]